MEKLFIRGRDLGLMSDAEFDPARLEDGIRDVVIYLRSRGFKTKNSCHGYSRYFGFSEEGRLVKTEDFKPEELIHVSSFPWVLIDMDENCSAEETRLRLDRELTDGGYRQFCTSVQHTVDKGGESVITGVQLQFSMSKVDMCKVDKALPTPGSAGKP